MNRVLLAPGAVGADVFGMGLPDDAEEWTVSLAKRIARGLSNQAEDWLEANGKLTRWEEAHLVDNPDDPKLLADHAKALGYLERLGGWLLKPLQDPLWPDPKVRDMVLATMQELKDRRAMWHGKLTKEESDTIIREVFGES